MTLLRKVSAGRLGGGTAEEVFCEAAVGISEGSIRTQQEVLAKIKKIVPEDQEFERAFLGFGNINTGRAKYLLSCLERQYLLAHGMSAEASPDWSGKSVSVEHILAESSGRDRFASDDEYRKFLTLRNTICNYTLLERTLNRNLEDRLFVEKSAAYSKSAFALTKTLSEREEWTVVDGEARARELADLAIRAWPTL